MNKYLKTVLGFLIVLIPAILLLGFLLKTLTKKSFYPVHGSEKISGITSPVKIYSDDYGVPHVIAQNEKDMFFAMGYMHARDRLFQMDLERRVAEGRLSEIFGNITLDYDKLFRTIGINRFSYSLYNNISPKSKEILDAYSNGVNKFIDTHSDELPVEFDGLNYKPEPWRPEHSLMITRLMGWELNIAWYTDYVMGELADKFGQEKVSEIFPDTNIALNKKEKILKQDSTELHKFLDTSIFHYKKQKTKKTDTENPIGEKSQSGSITDLGKAYFDMNVSYRKFFDLECSHMGSNCWVVSGERSESGKPLLANDPHLVFSAPSKWYEIHLKSGDFDVYGMSIPGAPGVVIGHNRAISWGMTNLMNDDNDFFIIDKDSISTGKNKSQVLKLDSTIEKISVRDSNEVEYSVRKCQDGTIISNLDKRSFLDNDNSENIYKNKLLTFRWTGFEYSDEILSFYKIDAAKNWEEFRTGLKDFGVPAQNFTYADTAGNIGYQAAGKVPIRKSGNINDNIYPYAGSNDWIGFVDFDKMPNTYNPKDGYVITANTNPFDWLKEEAKNKFYISYIWEPSSRYDRIRELITASKKLNLDEYKLFQMNNQSPYAREIAKYIVESYKNEPPLNEQTKNIVESFKTWNGEMIAGQSYGSIYNVFMCFLLKNIFQDKMGDKIFRDFLNVGNLSYRSVLLLLKDENQSSFWLSDKNKVIRKSFEESLQFLQDRFNDADPEAWHWGNLHKVKFRHPFGFVPALDKSFNIGEYEVGGDQTTINNSEFNFYRAINEGNFDDILGPSMRMLVDMSDVSHSLTVNSTGQSGQPLHPNYSDQTRLWLFGDYKHTTTNEREFIDYSYDLYNLQPQF